MAPFLLEFDVGNEQSPRCGLDVGNMEIPTKPTEILLRTMGVHVRYLVGLGSGLRGPPTSTCTLKHSAPNRKTE